MTLDFQFVSEDTVLIPAKNADAARNLAECLRNENVFEDIVPGIDSVFACFDPVSKSEAEVTRILANIDISKPTAASANDTIMEIPINYGGSEGPDLEHICAHLKTTPQDFIRRHTHTIYTVSMVGFTPGFAYIEDCPWTVSRLDHPRQTVPAGSVGIAAGFTGIYALDGPGGWPIVGRTHLPLFDAKLKNPFTLSAGQKIRFIEVKT
jgi:KipI family sensor histidine kinase inhibitor